MPGRPTATPGLIKNLSGLRGLAWNFLNVGAFGLPRILDFAENWNPGNQDFEEILDFRESESPENEGLQKTPSLQIILDPREPGFLENPTSGASAS